MTGVDVRLAVETGSGGPARCTNKNVRRAVAGAVRALASDDLDGLVRPWDLPELRRSFARAGRVTAAVVVYLDEQVLAVELRPGGLRILLRGVDDGWRLTRFAEPGDVSLSPETVRTVSLTGWGPDAVLTALGVVKPEGVTLERVSEYLGQGQMRTVDRYQWTDADRSVLAEHVTREIYDGATPYSTLVRGVVVQGDRGKLLTGSGDTAIVVEG